MKKTLILALLVFWPAAAHADSVTVSHMKGSATLIRGDQTLPVTKGLFCRKGDKIQTSEGCEVDLALNDTVGCRVLASSDCELVETDAPSMRLALSKGNAVFNLKKLPVDSSFQVETPSAVAAVRGTQFWGRVDTSQMENPITTFAVREGRVDVFVKSLEQNFTLNKGQALDIPKNIPVPLVRPALQAELDAMALADSIKTSA